MPSGQNQAGKKRGPYKKRFTPEERFWQKVAKGDGCWEWTGAVDPKGYGRLRILDRIEKAHRYSYELHEGPIPEGLMVCHTCDNPPCVRPDHLWLGTAKDNTQDMLAKGRGSAIHGDQNHKAKLSRADVLEIVRLSGEGWTNADLGRKYTISESTISMILKGKRWGTVTGITAH